MAGSIEDYDSRKAERDGAPSSIAKAVHNYILRKYGPLKNASKHAARDASFGDHKVSHHTARGWFRGTEPCHRSIEIMAARCAELAAELELERRKLRDLLSS